MVLLSQLAQQLPPIRVIVQPPAGLPFWETTVISALVGTFFRMASSIGIEFVKPYMTKKLMRKSALKHLGEEFLSNHAAVLAAIQILEGVNGSTPERKGRAIDIVGAIHRSISTDRFKYYFDTQKALPYEIDDGYDLGKFYSMCGNV